MSLYIFEALVILIAIVSLIYTLCMIKSRQKDLKELATIKYFLESTLREVSESGDFSADKACEVFSTNNIEEIKSISYTSLIRNLETFRRSSDSLIYVVELIKKRLK